MSAADAALTPVPACPACGSDTTPSVLRAADRTGFGYRQCSTCRTGWCDPQPDPGRVQEFYDRGYFVDGGPRGGYSDYDADAGVHRANAARTLSVLDRLVPASGDSPRTLVDIGTATGYLPQVATAGGWRAFGVEPSRYAATVAASRGISVVADTEHLPAELRGHVDAVTMVQVLEHVPDLDQTLHSVSQLLAPGGLLLCETWDVTSRVARRAGPRWQQLSAPSVRWVLSPDGTRELFARHGLDPVSWRRTVKSVSARTVTGQLAGRVDGPLARAARTAERSTRPLTARIRVKYGLDDLVLVTARRNARPAPRSAHPVRR